MSLHSIQLRYYTDEEIRKLAVVRVEHASTYDRGVPKTDGINDARMGLIDHTIRCPTCYKANCDQHFGYIELERPVYRLGTINTVIMILRSVCRECARPKFGLPGGGPLGGPYASSLVKLPDVLLHMDASREKLRLVSELCRSKYQCPHCGAPQPNYTKRARTFVDATYRAKDLASEFVKARGGPYLQYLKDKFMPDDAAAILHALPNDVISFFGFQDAVALMCHLQIVPPPIIRPSNFVGETKVRSENDLTVALQDVVRANIEFKNKLESISSGVTSSGAPQTQDYIDAYDKLQVMVSGIVNHAIKRTAAQNGLLPIVTATNKRKVIDLKCRLNGKKARVRGNLNGKRVDQSGRTVISGDASHDIDQLGVPDAMMNKLTFPEPVTDLNRKRLCTAILIGAYRDNGALAVRPPSHSQDHVIWLPILDLEARIELCAQLHIGWVVERHLVDGDWVLFNRQPSLWKASMMAFRAYRVPGLTVRLPLPVTRAFNADFDGDEMNIHALQGYEAIAEAQELMSVAQQIVTPQSNNVIIGLVQDSLVGAWRLSALDCYFDYDYWSQLMMTFHYEVPKDSHVDVDAYKECVRDSGVQWRPFRGTPWPAIVKLGPNCGGSPRWTGKQIISELLPSNIDYIKHEKATMDDYEGPSGLLISKGEFLAGRLNKSYLGAGNTGIVTCIWRLYGPGGTHKFLSDAQRLFVRHLAHDGPTQSIVDCLIDETHGNRVDGTLTVKNVLAQFLQRSDAVLSLDLPIEVKEAKSSSILQETLRSVGSLVLGHVRPTSALSNCVNSGSKGNVMNIAQIGGCVGQQTIYGRRVPLRKTRLGPRTLVYYAPGDLRAEARGFIANSYISGLTPAEFFEHQMAGREGIVATAVNTSESGYNQRRMIKGQESQCVSYDGTVRVSSNIIIETFYGGDDLDASRLERMRVPNILKPTFLESYGDPQTMWKPLQKCIEKARTHALWRARIFKELDIQFSCGIALGPLFCHTFAECPAKLDILKYVYAQLKECHMKHHTASWTCHDFEIQNISFAVAILQFALFLGHFQDIHDPLLKRCIDLYNKSLVNPGEGVGALGASSIGEPSMQMTLNVFHYSGIADKNVTITGLPRFKQLINGVDTFDTANMSAELRSFEDSHSVTQISTVMLSDVASSFEIQTCDMPLDDVFESFGSLRGPIASKLASGKYISKEYTSHGIFQKAVFHCSWVSMARKNITVETIAKSLRETLLYDAIVYAGPHWSSGDSTTGPSIYVIFAPWIHHDAVGPITEGLMAQQQVRGLLYVKNAIVFQEKTFNVQYDTSFERSRHIVETEGSNVIDLAKVPSIIPETIRTSNVVEACNVFGIATGLTILQSELHKVLSFDSSAIDARHTWLLADTMGRVGTLSAMNRHHMESLGSSLLQRASFEQSLDVFEEGASFGRSDPLAGATERIITGQPVCIGTGLVGIPNQNLQFGNAEHILVAPLEATREEHPAEYVPSLYHVSQPKENTLLWNPDLYQQKLTDANKEEQLHAMFQMVCACATEFRSTAATKRVVPMFKITKYMTAKCFEETLTMCNDWNSWTSRFEHDGVKYVYWDASKVEAHAQGVTVLHFGLELPKLIPKNYVMQIYNEQKDAHQQYEIYVKKELRPLDVPFGVEATRVVLQEESIFIKGLFQLTLAKQWHGDSNVESEDHLECPNSYVAILESTNYESILQNRCSDIQLANSFLSRLP